MEYTDPTDSSDGTYQIGEIGTICVFVSKIPDQNRYNEGMNVPKRSEIRPGIRVQIIEKHNQRSGALTEGIVSRILTNSPTHPHGIKVMLDDGRVGRVQAIVAS